MINFEKNNIKKTISSICIYFGMSFYSSFVFLFGKTDDNISLKHSKKKNKKQKTEILKINKIKYVDIINNNNILDDYIKKSIPIIITGTPSKYFNFLDDKYPIDRNNKNKNSIYIKEYILPELSPILDNFITRYIKKSVMYMASFSGNYKSTYAHIDSLASYNFYYVKEGSKNVYIVPYKNTKYLNMENGIDNVFVSDDKENMSNLQWLDKVPSFYNFTVNKGDILLFNNSKCIHKFENMNGNEIVYSIRLFSNDASSLILSNDIFNSKQADHLSKILLNGGMKRSTAYIK